MKWLGNWRRPDHRWPKYLPGGRFRTSTVAMVIVFAALSWLHQTYQPPAPDFIPEMAVVPPGFVPDPQYTWVPRTNVQTGDPEYTTTTPTSPTESSSPGETTSPSGLTPTSPTTTVSSDRSGSPSPQTSARAPSKTSTPATTSARPVTPTTAPSR